MVRLGEAFFRAAMNRVRSRLFGSSPPDLTGKGVRVAILDSGIDSDHPDLAGRVDHGHSKSTVALDSDLVDRSGHGTHIAGIICGSGEASKGEFRGVAPGVELIVIKVFGPDGRGFADDVAQGVLLAVEAGADIINYSASKDGSELGPPPWKWSPELDVLGRAFAYATSKGVLCIAAAGNAGPHPASVGRPGNLSSTLCVGALDLEGKIAEGSSRGPVYLDRQLPKGKPARFDQMLESPDEAPYWKPDVVVPGGAVPPWSGRPPHRVRLSELVGFPGGIVSTRSSHTRTFPPHDPGNPKDPYGSMPGTSQATGVATGLAALTMEYCRIRGLDLGKDPAGALANLLRGSARPLNHGDHRDWGHGELRWIVIQETVADCLASDLRRAAVLQGPQLKLLDEPPDAEGEV